MSRVGDMKAGLTSNRPRLSMVPRTAMIYTCRGMEYGGDKYVRGNYHGEPPPGVTEVERLLGYIDAAMRHCTRVTDAINRALGTGGDLAAACATQDTEASGNFPASMLPDLAHALASLSIGVTCAADAGLLPLDPGAPWRAHLPERGLPQKDDPATERARVLDLQLRKACGIAPDATIPSTMDLPTHDVAECDCRDCVSLRTQTTCEIAFLQARGAVVESEMPIAAPARCGCGECTYLKDGKL